MTTKLCYYAFQGSCGRWGIAWGRIYQGVQVGSYHCLPCFRSQDEALKVMERLRKS